MYIFSMLDLVIVCVFVQANGKLRTIDTLSGETTLAKIILPPSGKGVFCKRKEIAPKGSKFFSFREDPFFRRG